jgi:hypothetical protein
MTVPGGMAATHDLSGVAAIPDGPRGDTQGRGRSLGSGSTTGAPRVHHRAGKDGTAEGGPAVRPAPDMLATPPNPNRQSVDRQSNIRNPQAVARQSAIANRRPGSAFHPLLQPRGGRSRPSGSTSARVTLPKGGSLAPDRAIHVSDVAAPGGQGLFRWSAVRSTSPPSDTGHMARARPRRSGFRASATLPESPPSP